MTRYLAIGDIHGCFDSLQTLAELVEFGDDDVLITLGDYCNRGPNTCAVLDWLVYSYSRGNLRPLRGNHDTMMLNARQSESDLEKWISVGGAATLKSYSPFETDPGMLDDVPETHWHFLESSLLPHFEIDTHLFVHANAYPDIELGEQPDYMLYWEQFDDPPLHQSGKVMVCGHTSQKSGKPITNGNAICIDTWACGTGWLTCLDVKSGQIWQSNESGDTRQFWLDEL